MKSNSNYGGRAAWERALLPVYDPNLKTKVTGDKEMLDKSYKINLNCWKYFAESLGFIGQQTVLIGFPFA